MIFKQWKQVVGLELPLKTQTRRPRDIFDWSVHEAPGYWELPIECVYRHSGSLKRLRWVVGRTYAVQPGRGKKAVGRIEITKIRRERLGSIRSKDARAEGVCCDSGGFYLPAWDETDNLIRTNDPLVAFICLWNSIYGKGAWDRMKDDDVWVLDFEYVEEDE